MLCYVRAAGPRPWTACRARATCLAITKAANATAPSPFLSVATASTSASSTDSSSSTPKYSYHIASSFIGKDRPYDASTHVFHFNPYNRIRPPRHSRRSTRPDSGHDAFFVSRVNDSGAVAFGVADGVGGWTESGVDPADFSHGFCDAMATVAYEYDSSSTSATGQGGLTARRLIQSGYDSICADTSLNAGGSTACVAIAGPDGNLDVANLGDSGFLQLRLNAVNAHSEPQTHDFNTPFQLSLIPTRLAARIAAFGGQHLCDMPHDADVSQHRLRHGDVVLLATDGVLDNLFNQEILSIASRVMVSSGAWKMTRCGSVCAADSIESLVRPLLSKHHGSAVGKSTTLQSRLATELVTAAKAASINTKVDGPFAKESKKYYPHDQWRGGKVDDICVVVAVVSEERTDPGSKL
ncbi:hypothetical protein CDD82_1434 [Ophiocordyceps australis]|uniref:Protein phosphatase n=1 Tax=Ophiocordyceps australis TaxID=1399860 RepID=A0A2C5ZMA2_9HYPO|nr:hypothetical protein CDD82_1434 [Ophiocordyceps australis]